MNAFDIIVVVILAYSLIRGLFRGLMKELASIIGVLGGFFTAYPFYHVAAGYLSGHLLIAMPGMQDPRFDHTVGIFNRIPPYSLSPPIAGGRRMKPGPAGYPLANRRRRRQRP